MNQIVNRIRGSLQESVPPVAKRIILKDRVIKNGVMMCPHCNEEIHEKGTYSRVIEGTRNYKHFHGKCNGEILFPPPSPAEQKFLDQLRSYVSENTVNPQKELLKEELSRNQELAQGLRRYFDTDRVDSVVIQTHYGNDPLQIMEWWLAEGIMHISVQANRIE